jgi:hypothetical protein
MRMALCEIWREEAEYQRAAERFDIPGGIVMGKTSKAFGETSVFKFWRQKQCLHQNT